MIPFWKDKSGRPSRHADPSKAIAEYLEELREADVAGVRPPADALNGLGDAHLDLEDVASAIEYYRQAAQSYADGGHHDRAVACCLKIRRYAPTDAGVGMQLGRLYAAKKSLADAIVEFQGVIEDQRGRGNHELALEAAQELASIEPDRATHRERIAELALGAGKREMAIEALQSALERYERDADESAAHRLRRRIEDLEKGDRAQPPVKEEPVANPRVSAIRSEAEQQRSESRWAEAVDTYRSMARDGLADGADFEAWCECARQTGRAASVLEALAATSRWRLEHGDGRAARRAAEEMLLIDPESEAANEILEWVGPRGTAE